MKHGKWRCSASILLLHSSFLSVFIFPIKSAGWPANVVCQGLSAFLQPFPSSVSNSYSHVFHNLLPTPRFRRTDGWFGNNLLRLLFSVYFYHPVHFNTPTLALEGSMPLPICVSKFPEASWNLRVVDSVTNFSPNKCPFNLTRNAGSSYLRGIFQ